MKQQALDYVRRRTDKKCCQCGKEVCACLIIDDEHDFCGIKCYADWKKENERIARRVWIRLALFITAIGAIWYFF